MGYLLVIMQRFVNFLKVVKSNKLKNLYLIPQSDIYTNYENRVGCHPELVEGQAPLLYPLFFTL